LGYILCNLKVSVRGINEKQERIKRIRSQNNFEKSYNVALNSARQRCNKVSARTYMSDEGLKQIK
jgi:hypothetical protein